MIQELFLIHLKEIEELNQCLLGIIHGQHGLMLVKMEHNLEVQPQLMQLLGNFVILI